MIGAIVRTSLRFRLLILGIAVGVMAVGIAQLRDAPVDTLPEFTPPYVEIQTEALGLSAQEVEQLITVPLEADLLNGVQGVDTIRSKSVPGLSSIVMVFQPGTDVYRGRQLVQERLTQVGAAAFPNVSKPPTVLQPLSSSSRVMMIGLSSRDLSPIEKSVIARWTVRPRLMGVPGVANVSIWGFRDQQIQVQVDPETLRDRNVTLSRVISTTGNAQVATPLSYLEGSTPGTGGFIESPQQRLQVRNVFEKLTDPDELGKVPVEGTGGGRGDSGGQLRLSDVADIKVEHQPLIGDAVVNDGEGLLLVVEKFPGANTLEVTSGVEKALDKLKPGLSGLQADTSVFRPATFIEDATDNITLTLIIAGVLLALALAAFLFQWRTVLISLVTIPVALVAAALVLDALGETFNAISFAGLAVAIAVVIDEAVVGAENVARRLRAKRNETQTADIVRAATAEMRSPLTYGTLIALLAIVPVAAMEGRPGAFYQPLVLGYALAVGAAMLVALTLTPALSLLLFSRGSAHRESPVVRRLAPRYGAGLGRALGRPRAVLIGAAAAVVVAIAVLPLLDASVIPTFKDRDVLVRLDAEPGTSQPKMTGIATALSRELRSIDGVDNVGAQVGRAVTGDQIVDVNSGELWVSIDSDADYEATLARIKDAVNRTSGVQRDVVTYSTQKIRDVGALNEGDNPVRSNDDIDVLTGSDKPLVVRVYGQNLDVLRRQAERVRQVMSGVEGVDDPRIEAPALQPTVEIETNLAKARRFGIKPGDVRRAEAALLQGIQVGSVFDEQKVFDVIVQGTPATRRSVANVRNLLIDRPGGGHVRLGQVADVRIARTPISIDREAVSRRLDVEAGVSGRSLDSVANNVEDRLANVDFPIEYHAEVLEETTSGEINGGQMLAFAIAAAIAAFLLLQAAFRSWRLAVLAFLTLPVALVGGVVGALIDGAELSLGSLIGLLALLGLAARTGVVLIRHFQDLELERETFGRGLVERGARERLAPILASTSGIAALMIPFVVAGDVPGLEILHPMAVVVLCGLVSSTLLSLFVLPTLYLRFGGRRPTLSPDEELMHRWAGVEPVPAGAPAPEIGDGAAVEKPVRVDGDAATEGTQVEGSESGAGKPAA
jgi:CzcA family heavy metal efflux pump